MTSQQRRVQTRLVVNAASGVGHGDDAHASRGQHVHERAADLAVALDHGPRPGHGEAKLVEGGPCADEHALRRGSDMTTATADRQRLAGHHAGHRLPAEHRDRVHQPRHHIRVGVDVRRRNIAVWADHRSDAHRVPASQMLELDHRESRRVDLDTALRAAEGDVGDGGLPRHLGCECLEEVERHFTMVANAALGRAACIVVLHTETTEHLDAPVVHANRNTELKLPQRLTKQIARARIKV